eukprot:5499898-Prymnesium_polylepis.1
MSSEAAALLSEATRAKEAGDAAQALSLAFQAQNLYPTPGSAELIRQLQAAGTPIPRAANAALRAQRLGRSRVLTAQLTGKYSNAVRSLYSQRLVLGFSELPGKALLPGSVASSAYISDVRFDEMGELLAACSTDGRICVHQHQQFVCGAAAFEPAAAGGAISYRVPDGCEPLCTLTTQLSARAVLWNPVNQNELLCAFANSGDLKIFDLAAAAPGRPARVLRSAASQGVADALHLSGGSMVVAGGRDGMLRLWDVRAGSGAIVRQSAATKGWTLGLKAEVCAASHAALTRRHVTPR